MWVINFLGINFRDLQKFWILGVLKFANLKIRQKKKHPKRNKSANEKEVESKTFCFKYSVPGHTDKKFIENA